jgi:ELWxxDGT repeat protein
MKFIISCSLFLISLTSIAQSPRLVADINTIPIPYGSEPDDFINFNNQLYFTANTPGYGRELWKYDKVSGASLVKDIASGSSSSDIDGLKVINNYLYFSADDNKHGDELWRTDGINPPYLVKNIAPGITGSRPDYMTAYKDGIAFLAYYDRNEYLFYLNAKDSLKRLINYPLSTSKYNHGIPQEDCRSLFVIGNNIYSAFDFEDGKSKFGFVNDTTDYPFLFEMAEESEKGSQPNNIIKYKDKIYFVAYFKKTGREIFCTQDTIHLSLFFQTNKSTESSKPHSFKVLKDTLWWLASDSLGREYIHRYGNGTIITYFDEEGDWNPNVNFKDVLTSFNKGFVYVKQVDANNRQDNIDLSRYAFEEEEKEIFTIAGNNTRKYKALGVYNREQNTQTLIKTKDSIPLEYNQYNGRFAIFDDQLVFCANDGQTGHEIWSYDGINPATQLCDINKASFSSNVRSIVSIGSTIYMVANDGKHGHEVWKYEANGKASMLKDVEAGELSSNPSKLTLLDNKLYFQAQQKGNPQIYVYSENGETQLLNNTLKTVQFKWATLTEVFNEQLRLLAESVDGRNGEWLYDGENEPVFQQNINGNTLGIYFNRDNFPYWTDDDKISDSKSTSDLQKEFKSEHKTFFDAKAIQVNGTRLVLGYNPSYGFEPWIYTENNLPELLNDYYPGPKSSKFSILKATDKMVYFSCYNKDGIYSWWAYDGINEPKQIISFDDNWEAPTQILYFDNKLYFTANKDYGDNQLWSISDKTALKAINRKREDEDAIREIKYVFKGINKLFFIASDNNYDEGLWEYNGNSAPNKIQHADYNFGKNEEQFLGTDKYIFYTYNDPDIGNELWMYDGINPPKALTDIQKGDKDSNPRLFHLVGNKLYFLANDGFNGEELWMVDIE